eukprot:CAMPEP_0203924510 /NCGR_PEP_ID=MMETSP0359-20131031/64253_1 /ASSEMBLY_ACC=CAM_ASM_000338 /TAXON_ID=268821 /ORGANISM="Scrippsiella Hangoei, Strain SHTV-5" /LENGTH=62 /DNA_ID=CAMNT_0050852755 /DNA_START=872 /DNA_END=1060 /DNA_ORIENTATION=-
MRTAHHALTQVGGKVFEKASPVQMASPGGPQCTGRVKKVPSAFRGNAVSPAKAASQAPSIGV